VISGLHGPRAYRAQLHHGERAAGGECLVVLDFSPGEPAAAARCELERLGVQLAEAAYIRPGEYGLCWLALLDAGTGERVTAWRLR